MAAALKLLALWAVAGGTLLFHQLTGIPGRYLGQGHPETPSLPVTVADLLFLAVLVALPILALAALFHWLRFRWLALPVLAGPWLWAADALVFPFRSDFGTTWTDSEVFFELTLDPVYTPLALALFLMAAALLLRRPTGPSR